MLNIFFSAMVVSVFGLLTIIQHDISVLKTSVIQQAKEQMNVLSIDFVRIKTLGEVETVSDTVSRLRSFPFIKTIYFYDIDHKLVFHYFKSKRDRVAHKNIFNEYEKFTESDLEIVTEVKYLEQSYGWVYLRTTPKYISQIVGSYQQTLLFIILGAILLSYFMARWLQGSIAKPIINLLNTVNYISETHDYTRQIKTTEENEIGALYQGINGMLSEIYLASRALQDSEAQFRLLLESTNEGIYGMTLTGVCTFANPACLAMFEIENPKNLIGHFVNQVVLSVDTRSNEKFDYIFDDVYFKSHFGSQEIMIKGVSEREIITEHWFSPIVKNTKIIGVVATFFDITERKNSELQLYNYQHKLEKLVDERSEELITKNKELEAFTYSVSHDLRAPLRAINGFSTALQEDYLSQLDDEAIDYVNRIKLAVTKMNFLIDGLLTLSKLTGSEIHVEQINLSEIAHTVIDDLRAEESLREVEVFIESDLIVQGDKKMLTILLQNLLSNSWKYTNKQTSAKISVQKVTDSEPYYFLVKDNGAGFDARSAKNIFTPFQRFHREVDFEGTGIGLAIVSRIVKRHGGKIWAESVIKQGSSFCFTLPNFN